MRYALMTLMALGCRTGEKPAVEDEPIPLSDADGDGYDADEDCDDQDSEAYPSAEEICDGIDNNCDGIIDEGVQETFYLDSDNDGFGDSEQAQEACEAPEGYVANGSDCNDNNEEIYPSAPEACDGLDNNCDSNIDEGLLSVYYLDEDGDGWGVTEQSIEACDPGEGYATQGGDCNDTESESHPGNTEVCDQIDNDCDGAVDDGLQLTFYEDQDNDGFGNAIQSIEACEAPTGYVNNSTDCNDSNTGINPDANEVCDLEDNNCDGIIDEDTAVDAQVWYADNDNDNYGNLNDTQSSCYQPQGYISDNTDCDDEDNDIYPGAPELCSTPDDDNCDGTINENTAIDSQTWFADSDGDGYGDGTTSLQACLQPSTHVSDDTDCDDTNGSIHPGITETVDDGVDNDCDGSELCYQDSDNDGFRHPDTNLTVTSADLDCLDSNEGQQSDPATDCDDTNDTIYPGATEIIDNGTDDNCDNTELCYADNDNDDFRTIDISVTVTSPDLDCDDPGEASQDLPASDCDDNLGAINPDADEVCDGIDNNCDTFIDESTAVDASTWYADTDNDGFGDQTNITLACDQPSGFVADNTDCLDTNIAINPNADEICDGIDNNCDTITDENTAVDAATWYSDSDIDGFGDPNNTTLACDQPSGFVADNTDCLDTNDTINPNANEVCDGIDNNCNTAIDENSAIDAQTWYFDNDGDGYGSPSSSQNSCSQPSQHVSNNGDCNDFVSSINPVANELCDGVDNNCNGVTDENTAIDVQIWYFDNDNDGYGVDNDTLFACTQPSGYSALSGDCNDSNASVVACTSCDAILAADLSAQTGIYELDPCNNGNIREFWCDMDRDGGGWTLAGWQSANATTNMGVDDLGTVGGSNWSRDLACIDFSEVMVFNDDLEQYFVQSYPAQVWSFGSTNLSIGTNGNAFKHGSYGPSNSLIMMGCVNYQYGAGNVTAYACDSDGQSNAQGHLADYAGEYCSGGRLDYTWAWSNGSTCSSRGQQYTWGYAIR